MPLIVKGEMIVKSAEGATPQIIKPAETKVEPPVEKAIRKKLYETAPPVSADPTDHYHHAVEGDLHKLINKKSDYLKDMIDF